MELEIVYQDEYMIAVNKPHGLLVHRTNIAKHATEFALQLLRDQINRKVYPVHRLDRKTSGVLLFALSEEMNQLLSTMFMNGDVCKEYCALVRGFTDQQGVINYDLKRDDGKVQSAITGYHLIQHYEIDLPFGNFKTSRYSMLKIVPKTGRMHQIRKHLAHIDHPIIGDRPHGCNKQNKLFLENFNLSKMMLHASSLKFIHPILDREIKIEAKRSSEMNRILESIVEKVA